MIIDKKTIINKKQTRHYLRQRALALRKWKPTRVSPTAVDRVELGAQKACDAIVIEQDATMRTIR